MRSVSLLLPVPKDGASGTAIARRKDKAPQCSTKSLQMQPFDGDDGCRTCGPYRLPGSRRTWVSEYRGLVLPCRIAGSGCLRWTAVLTSAEGGQGHAMSRMVARLWRLLLQWSSSELAAHERQYLYYGRHFQICIHTTLKSAQQRNSVRSACSAHVVATVFRRPFRRFRCRDSYYDRAN